MLPRICLTRVSDGTSTLLFRSLVKNRTRVPVARPQTKTKVVPAFGLSPIAMYWFGVAVPCIVMSRTLPLGAVMEITSKEAKRQLPSIDELQFIS